MIIRNSDRLNSSFRLLYEQAKVLLYNGKEVDVEVKEYKKKRSSQQNSYYWLFNGWVRDCLNGAGLTYGEFNLPYTSDLVHEINKKVFGKDTTTKMRVGEFCNYMTQVIAFWIEKTCGALEIPELPDSYLERYGYAEYLR